MSIEIISEQTLRDNVKLNNQALQSVEKAFIKLAENKVTMPAVMHIDIADFNGEVDVKSAYIHGLDKFAIKQSSGFFDNPKKGLPSSGGLMIVMDATTGFPAALLLDNGYLTDIRTALAGAIAAKHIANSDIHTVSVIGAGNQAEYQLTALQLVRSPKQVLVYARDRAKAQTFVDQMQQKLDIPIKIADSVKDACQAADLLITTTPSTEPIIKPEYLHPGLHITAMGSDAAIKNEIDPECFNHFDHIVTDDTSQCLTLGECHHADKNDLYEPNEHKTINLGEVIKNNELARQNPCDITLCDLTGTGAQDTAIARFALNQL